MYIRENEVKNKVAQKTNAELAVAVKICNQIIQATCKDCPLEIPCFYSKDQAYDYAIEEICNRLLEENKHEHKREIERYHQ